jgi:L-serine/L-threonine ammonia-lyase
MERICADYWERGYRDFISSSGGNAGYSLAMAALGMGGRVRVIMPESTPEFIRKKIEAIGADVEVHGAAWDETHAYASVEAEKTGAAYIPPFDHPLLWEGHSSIITECVGKMDEPNLVVVAVGGGGLLCGVMQGMEAVGWKNAEVLTAETFGAASYAKSLAAGKLVTLDKIDTVAGTLGAKTVASAALEWSNKRSVRSFLCSDEEALAAAKSFANAMGTLVEPACGAALAAVYERSEVLGDATSILMIVCGGIGVFI